MLSTFNDIKSYKTLIDNIKEVVFQMDNSGTFVFLNRAWSNTTGFSVEEVLYKNFIDYIHQEDRKKVLRLNESLMRLQEKSHISEVRLLTKGNEYLSVEIFLKALIDDRGKVKGLIGSIDKNYLKETLEKKSLLLKKAEDEILYMTYYDSLTKLPNLQYLKRIFGSKQFKDGFNNENLALLYIDIDRFKNINDTLGYDIGDKLLIEISNKLKHKLQNEKNMVVKGSGDEFIILSEFDNKMEVDDLLENVLKIFKKPIMVNGYELFVSVSIGISIYSEYCNNIEALINASETAMYRVKSQGRDGYEYFNKNMNVEDMRIRTIENQLRKAIERKEFFLLFQPRIDAISGNIRGVEALIRWSNPKVGIIYPLEFITIAEETGLIVDIGEWVLKESCKQVKKWHKEGYKINISVNISARQLQTPNFVKVVKNIVDEIDIDPRFLELEITENSIMKNFNMSVEIIKELKNIGVDIAIDDFGTGFSSLSYIKQFEPNTLKIDKSFIKDIDRDENDISITLAIINMTRSLKIRSVAEGVETIEQLKVLKENNCDEIQGYLFSKPESVEKINELLIRNKSFTY